MDHPFPLSFSHEGLSYEAWVSPSPEGCFKVNLNGVFFGEVRGSESGGLAGAIASEIEAYCQRVEDEEELERHNGSAGAFEATEEERDEEE